MATVSDIEKTHNDHTGNTLDGSADPVKLSPTSSTAVDDNYELYRQHAGEVLDTQEAKRVLRKIDRRVVPILFLIYLLQYLDKNGINYASAFGLEDGTHLTGQVSRHSRDIPGLMRC